MDSSTSLSSSTSTLDNFLSSLASIINNNINICNYVEQLILVYQSRINYLNNEIIDFNYNINNHTNNNIHNLKAQLQSLEYSLYSVILLNYITNHEHNIKQLQEIKEENTNLIDSSHRQLVIKAVNNNPQLSHNIAVLDWLESIFEYKTKFESNGKNYFLNKLREGS
jgi:hypothetical protein